MLTIIDYNLGSVDKVTDAYTELGIKFKITKNENDIIGSEKIVLSGTEEALSVIKKLHLLNLFTVLRLVKKPVLGIGLGMQLLSEFSREGDVACLGKFTGTVEKFDSTISKVPFSGNNKIRIDKNSRLFKDIDDSVEFRFRNSTESSISLNNLLFLSILILLLPENGTFDIVLSNFSTVPVNFPRQATSPSLENSLNSCIPRPIPSTGFFTKRKTVKRLSR